jgi:hypothetical protein
MRRYFTYEFDSKKRILYKYYFGVITAEDIKSSWEYAFERGLIPDRMEGFIIDYRRAQMNIKRGEEKEISEFYKEHIEIFGNYKIAVITEKPEEIVVPVLVEAGNEGFFSRPFSTMEGARTWMTGF